MRSVNKSPFRLDRRVTLRSLVSIRNSIGESVSGYADLATVWAGKVPQQGREFVAAQARHAELSDIFRIRFREDLTAKSRVLLGSVVYDMVAPPVEVGRRDYLDLACRALEGESAVATAHAFIVDLDQGDIEKDITYPTAFASAPNGVSVDLIIPSGGFTFKVAIVSESRAADGFTVALGAAVPASGYKLSIIAVK